MLLLEEFGNERVALNAGAQGSMFGYAGAVSLIHPMLLHDFPLFGVTPYATCCRHSLWRLEQVGCLQPSAPRLYPAAPQLLATLRKVPANSMAVRCLKGYRYVTLSLTVQLAESFNSAARGGWK